MSFAYRGDRRHVLVGDGLTNGYARVPGPHNRELTIVFSDGLGWEHVSVSTPSRCPNWLEMCFCKNLFWAGEDTVIQYHPAKSEYINLHPFTLHLWRPQGINLPTPDPRLVGLTVAELKALATR
jgi:hypothetical protein